jgi:PAS domain S-box-containing protein
MEDTEKLKQQPTEQVQERKEGRPAANTFIDSMTLINRSYVYDFASETYCRDHGRSKKEILGNTVAYIWGETNFRKFIKKNLDDCFAGKVVRYENWLDVPGQGQKYYRVSYSPYFDATGQVTHAIVASLDITDFKKEEEAVEKSEPGFRTIMKSMHYGVFTFDTEGSFTFVNDVVIKRSGYPREWYVGKNLFEVVRPQERQTVQEHFKATVRGEQVPPYEFAYRRAADDLAWVQISTTAIREGGRIVGVLGIIVDITKRIKSEQALKENEEKYRRLFEDSRDAIFITDREGKLTDVNRSFLNLFGYTKEETKELHAVDTYVNREDCRTYVKTIKEQGFVDYLEVKLKKKDGTVMDCLLNGTPLQGADGTIQGYQGIARDETDKKRLR